MFIREDTGQIVTDDNRGSTLRLAKLLYRLNIINIEKALDIATKFRIFFV